MIGGNAARQFAIPPVEGRSSQSEEALGIAEAYRLALDLAQRCRLDEPGGLVAVLERIVDREQHAVEAHCVDRAAQRLGREDAGGGDGDVPADIRGGHLAERYLGFTDLEAAVDAPEVKGERLAHMAEDDRERGEAAEESGEHQPQRMTAGLGRPAEDRLRET